MPGSGSERSRTADGFVQASPRLANPFDDDELLRELLARHIPADALEAVRAELRELGDVAVRFAERQLVERRVEPLHVPWDPWGTRIDAIELTPLWRDARRLAAERGLVAIAYERSLGDVSRIHQFAANYVVQASLDFYSCPLAMSDGAARTLLDLGGDELVRRAVPHLISRDPEHVWTSGQWMTERTGGSDVSLTETVASHGEDGWRLRGTKWFASAATSEMALTLARPEGNPAGSRGLALFYVETRDAEGRLRGIVVNRLKDKLGTRKVPTAELTLDATPAVPVNGLVDGVRHITPMLTVTRVWNAMGAAWLARRATALARDYARRRVQFGAPLVRHPLHVDTLAGLEAETRGVLLVAMHAAALLGRREASGGTDETRALLRAVTPLAKLTTAKQAVAIVTEAIEALGGAGYVEDTGLPALLRDAHVLPIWEGTTNVLALDLVRALGDPAVAEAFTADLARRCAATGTLDVEAAQARAAATAAMEWLVVARDDRERLEAGARRAATALGRALELALLVEHARWTLAVGRDSAAPAAARRFARNGLAVGFDEPLDDARRLAGDAPER